MLALVGALPVAAGFIVRTATVRNLVAAETARLGKRLAGVDASYEVSVQLLPLELVLRNVVVSASDGGSPALTVRRMAVTPRLFSLLAGRFDAGDIEVDEPRARVVVKDGKVLNVAYRLPETKGESKPLERAPFTSLALTDAAVSLDVDGVHADAGPLDLDVLAEPGLAFEVSLRVGESRVSRTRDGPHGPAVDEDVVCELDGRVRVERSAVLVRRLSVLGSADLDPAAKTFGRCTLGDADPARVAVRLSEVRVTLDQGKPVLADGHVVTRVPLAVANRFAPGPFTGWVSAVADVRWDAKGDLPDLRGRIKGGDLGMGVYKFATDVDGEVEIASGEIRVKTLHATYGHATATVEDVSVKPLADGLPLRVRRLDSKGLRFPDLMEWNDVTPNTIVQWNLDHVVVSEFGGTLSPLRLDGDVQSETSDFEIFDRAYHDPARKHMIGVKAANVHTRFGVRPDAVLFMNSRASFGGSDLLASVSVGFNNEIWLSVPKGGKLRLSDISPIVDIPIEGNAELGVTMAGKASTAELKGDLSIKDFVFGGFSLGDIESSRVRFKPLKLDLSDVRGSKGASRFVAEQARIDFDTEGAVLVNANVKSDRLDLRDFFAMFHFDEDPRFDQIAGRGTTEARIEYDLGGPKDRCKNGYLRVDGRLALTAADLFEEHYDGGDARFDFRWMDEDASYLGMQLDAPSVTLRKGEGTILGSVSLTDGANVRAHLVASSLPLSKIDALGSLGKLVDGHVNAVAEIGGTLDAMTADIDARGGPVRIGRATLPGSDVRVHLEPIARPSRIVGKSACGRPMTGPFDPADYAADHADGVFHASGQLFGGQIAFEDVAVTRQRDKTVRGDIIGKSVDLGALAELSPAGALSDERLDGRFSGKISLRDLAMAHPGFADASLDVEELGFGRKGFRVELDKPARMDVSRGRLETRAFTIAASVPTGERALFDVSGGVDGLGGTPKVALTLALRPTELSALARFFPQAERVSGTLAGSLRVNGTWPKVTQGGRFTLKKGELSLRNAPLTFTDVDVAVGIEPDEIRIENATAAVGGGTLDVRGAIPLAGFTLGSGRAAITARNVNLPLSDGVRSQADADLVLAFQPSRPGSDDRAVPKLTGDVTLRSFRYTRKVTVAADIDTLTKRGHRTRFDSYDPDNDLVDFDVRIRAPRPLEIDNDLVEAKLVLGDSGLVLSGTNQRFGMRGELELQKGGRIRLRRNEFEITQGIVRFDDDERIAPRVDVTAVTEYHRYDDNLAASPASSGATGGGASAAGSTPGGRWRITMHAHGDADTLRIDLSSEPALSQDDIFLLLTLGLTRAELDRAQSATAGGSVALEALGTLTGADEAVTETIPVIDEFKLGSAYSSRTGRTEPTVTIGKRLAQRIRAYVTSGLSESREVRSNLQWRLSPKVSVEGSYDNVNDISTSSLGNLGADVRFRLEFQ